MAKFIVPVYMEVWPFEFKCIYECLQLYYATMPNEGSMSYRQ